MLTGDRLVESHGVVEESVRPEASFKQPCSLSRRHANQGRQTIILSFAEKRALHEAHLLGSVSKFEVRWTAFGERLLKGLGLLTHLLVELVVRGLYKSKGLSEKGSLLTL